LLQVDGVCLHFFCHSQQNYILLGDFNNVFFILRVQGIHTLKQ
jgi:hypothetical protein